MNTPTPRGRFQGVLQILRFNWPMYVTAAIVLGGGALLVNFLPLNSLFRALAFIGLAAAAFWLIVSLGVSHYVYDLAGIYRGDWLSRALTLPPKRYANLHAGLDEFSDILAAKFPQSQSDILDFFDAERMTEPSIARARATTKNQPFAQPVHFAALPLPNDELDAAFLIFAAHELREPEARAHLLRELHRALKSGGRIVLLEHLRDFPNFLAFGPGFLHFHSRAQWLRDLRTAQLKIADEFTLTPFVRAIVLEKS